MADFNLIHFVILDDFANQTNCWLLMSVGGGGGGEKGSGTVKLSEGLSE